MIEFILEDLFNEQAGIYNLSYDFVKTAITDRLEETMNSGVFEKSLREAYTTRGALTFDILVPLRHPPAGYSLSLLQNMGLTESHLEKEVLYLLPKYVKYPWVIPSEIKLCEGIAYITFKMIHYDAAIERWENSPTLQNLWPNIVEEENND